MSEPAQVTIGGADLVAWGDASFEPGAAIAFDLRAPEGPTPIFEQTRQLLQLGMVVGFYDTDVIVPSFAVGLLDGIIIVCTEDGNVARIAPFRPSRSELVHAEASVRLAIACDRDRTRGPRRPQPAYRSARRCVRRV